jgi:chaperone modulatory protein CbpM
MMSEAEILTRIAGLTPDRLTLCVTRAWVRPRLSDAGQVFDDTDLARLRLIVELSEDMAVSDETMPLILNLLDEVTTLRRRMRSLDAALGAEGLRERLRMRLLAMHEQA